MGVCCRVPCTIGNLPSCRGNEILAIFADRERKQNPNGACVVTADGLPSASAGGKTWSEMRRESVGEEMETGLPRAAPIKRIMMQMPDKANPEEKEQMLWFVKNALVCVCKSLKNPVGRGCAYTGLTPSDISFALTALDFSSEPAIPLEVEMGRNTDDSGTVTSGITETTEEEEDGAGTKRKAKKTKGNRYVKRKLNTGSDKKDCVLYYSTTKKEIQVWLGGVKIRGKEVEICERSRSEALAIRKEWSGFLDAEALRELTTGTATVDAAVRSASDDNDNPFAALGTGLDFSDFPDLLPKPTAFGPM